jgi:hypothetical protein
MVMVERSSVVMEKPLPAEDPMDAEELVDPTFRHDHKVRDTRSRTRTLECVCSPLISRACCSC